MRSIIIGDVHGCNAELCALLDKVGPKPQEDRLILLGDLFDRGPESYEVYQTVQALACQFAERFVLLRGNHEDYLLSEKLSLSQRIVWERVGRHATAASFKRHGARMEDAIPFLSGRCVNFYRGEGFMCVHAGIKIDPPELNDTYTLLHDHGTVLQNRYIGPLAVCGHIALEKPSYFCGDGKTVQTLPYGEHLALPKTGVICIDTGCGKGGRLSAMITENGEYTLIGNN
ncbi:MAG: serine/threonine protein phosphatase [Clostridia bacterium]|nr:serine/threonine protein phosphatase [Clostridia bacterium]